MKRKAPYPSCIFIAMVLTTVIGLVRSCDIMAAAKCTDNMTVVFSSAGHKKNDVIGRLCTIRLGEIETCLKTNLLGCSRDGATDVNSMKVRYEKMKANLTHICNSVNGCENMVQRSIELSKCLGSLEDNTVEANDKDEGCRTISSVKKCIDSNLGSCEHLKNSFTESIRPVDEKMKTMECGGVTLSQSFLWAMLTALVAMLLSL